MPTVAPPSERKPREPSLAVQSTFLTLARVLGYVVAFFIPILLVRIFTQEQFGFYKQALLVAETALPILNFGLNASLFYFLPRQRLESRPYLVQALTLLWTLGLAGGGFVALAAEPIAAWMDQPELAHYLPIIGAYIAFSQPGTTLLYLPIIDRRPALAAGLHFGNEVLKLAVAATCALVFGSVQAVLIGMAALAAIRAFLLIVYVRVRPAMGTGRANWAALKTQLAYALPFALAVLFEIALAKAHQYFVSARVSPADFAIYAAGVVQVPLASLLSLSVAEVVLVRAAALFREGDLDALRRIWIQSLARLCVFILPIWIGIEFFARDLIVLLFGAEYEAATPVFRIFVTASLWTIVIDNGLLRAVGDTRFLLLANVVGFVASVAVMILGPAETLMFSAVTAYVVGYAVTRILGLARVSQHLQLPWSQAFPFGAFTLALTLSVVTSGIGYLSTRGLDSHFVRLLIAVPAVAVAYGVLVTVVGLVPAAETKAFLRRMRGRLPG